MRLSDRPQLRLGSSPFFQQTSEIPQEKSETLQKTSSITSSAEEVIDEVLISLFRAPHSYTGEDSTEIMCHGSSYILQQVIQLLIYNGCRAALPGEYTQRAFLNGISLVCWKSVLLIFRFGEQIFPKEEYMVLVL